jgi:aldose 1-epimerase
MSRYQVQTGSMQGAAAYYLTDDLRGAQAVVLPEIGCNCIEFRTTPEAGDRGMTDDNSLPVEVFVPTEDLNALRQNPIHAGLPILFPFPNRVREGDYRFEGRSYRMAHLLAKGWDRSAGHAIHGLVAERSWTVEEAVADEKGAALHARLQLDAIPEIFEQYPFPCRIAVTYRLCEGVLEMTTEVTNTGTGRLPMGFGIHPWFPTALRPGAKLPAALADISPGQRAAAEVRIPAEAVWELENLMPTGKIIPVEEDPEKLDLRTSRPLNGLDFDHVFTRVTPGEEGWSEGGLRDPESGLEMVLKADRAFREWVLYAPVQRPWIALEPYTCVTDAVNLQLQGLDAGLITLAPQQTWRGVLQFGLRRYRA